VLIDKFFDAGLEVFMAMKLSSLNGVTTKTPRFDAFFGWSVWFAVLCGPQVSFWVWSQ